MKREEGFSIKYSPLLRTLLLHSSLYVCIPPYSVHCVILSILSSNELVLVCALLKSPPSLFKVTSQCVHFPPYSVHYISLGMLSANEISYVCISLRSFKGQSLFIYKYTPLRVPSL